jgi:hypothetical protein
MEDEDCEPKHIRPDLFYKVITPKLTVKTTSLFAVNSDIEDEDDNYFAKLINHQQSSPVITEDWVVLDAQGRKVDEIPDLATLHDVSEMMEIPNDLSKRTGLETLDEQLQKMMDECIAEADFSPIFPDTIQVYSNKDDQGNRISNAQMKQRTEYHLQGKE